MNILQVTSGLIPVPPPGFGATEKAIDNLSASFTRLGHNVTVVDIPFPERIKTPYDVEEINFLWKPHNNIFFHAMRGLSFGWAVRKALPQLVRERKIDVAHFHSQFSGAVCIPAVHKLGIPSVFTSHSWIWSLEDQARSRWQHARFTLELRALANAREVICDGITVANNIRDHLGVPEERLNIIKNGVDERMFAIEETPDAALRNQYDVSEKLVVLNVARSFPYKNQLRLAHAVPKVAEHVPNVEFLFVGPVGSPAYAKQVEEALEPSIAAGTARILGEVNQQALAELYNIADVFILCSTAEAQGMVVSDAMAAGRAIVASRIGAFEEMLGTDAGVLADPFDPEDIARSVTDLLQNPEKRRVLSHRARDVARSSYGWDTLAEQTTKLYQRAIQNSHVA